MKKAKVLIALMLIISLVFPSAGMAAGSIKDTSSTKEVSGKPEIKISSVEFGILDPYDEMGEYSPLTGPIDMASTDEYYYLKDNIKLRSDRFIGGELLVEYSKVDEQTQEKFTYTVNHELNSMDEFEINYELESADYDFKVFKYNNQPGDASGEYKLSKATYTSSSGEEYTYTPEEVLGDGVDASFSMINTISDPDKPVLKSIATDVSGEIISSDENVCITAKASDDKAGIKKVVLYYDNYYGDKKIDGTTIYLDEKRQGVYEFNDAIEEQLSDVPSELRLNHIEITDKATNKSVYSYTGKYEDSSDGKIKECEKLTQSENIDLKFSNGQTEIDREAPFLKDIKVLNSKGNEIKDGVVSADESLITLQAVIEDSSNNKCKGTVCYRNSKSNGGELYDFEHKKGNIYECEIDLTDSNLPKKFTLENLEIFDQSKNCREYNYTGIKEEYEEEIEYCEKLEKNIDLTFEAGIDDNTPPTLETIKIIGDKNVMSTDEVTIKATSKDQDAEYITVTYEVDRGSEVDYSYCYSIELYKQEDGSFQKTDSLWNENSKPPFGLKLDHISVFDKYNNESVYSYDGREVENDSGDYVASNIIPNGENIDITFKDGTDFVDRENPVLEVFNPELTAEAPGIHSIKIKVNDDSPEAIVRVFYKNIKTGELLKTYTSIDTNILTEMSVLLDEYKDSGEYKLERITVNDTVGNGITYVGNLRDYTSEEWGEVVEFPENIEKGNITITNTVYKKSIAIEELLDIDKLNSLENGSAVRVIADYNDRITVEMLRNIKNSNKDITYCFSIDSERAGFDLDLKIKSSSITEEYINSLGGKSITLIYTLDLEKDNSFIDYCKEKFGFKNKIEEVHTDNDEEFVAHIKTFGWEACLPLVDQYAKKNNIKLCEAGERLFNDNYYFDFRLGKRNEKIKLPIGTKININDEELGELDNNLPFKVYRAGEDINNLEEYETESVTLNYRTTFGLEETGRFFMSYGDIGYKEDTFIDITKATVVGIKDSTYTGSAVIQYPVVKITTENGQQVLLKENKDYKVTYENNVNAGTAKVIITGMGAYKGQIVKTFTISKKASTLNVPTSRFNKTYGNSRFNLGVSSNTKVSYVSSNSNVASVDQSGNVTIKGVGIANITVTALGNSNYAPVQKSIVISVGKGTASVKASNYKKTRSSKKFKVTASSTSGGKLIYSSSNKKVATVSSSGYVTIKGIGKTTITIKSAATSKYNGSSKKITVEVVPKTMKINKVKAGNKSMKVYWSKDKYVSGYQVVIAKDKKFKKGKKTYKISKNKYTSKNISKLSKKKYYYVKMRSYKKVGRTYYYSNYSSVKKIKT